MEELFEDLLLSGVGRFLSRIGFIVGIVLTVGFFAYRLKRNKKMKKQLENGNKVRAAVMTLICEAEKKSNYSGEEKKDYVMTRANQFCIDNKIKFNAETTDRIIQEIIELTKQVNTRTSTKTESWL